MHVPLRFTIRDLHWLTVVALVCVAWCVDRRSIQRQSANDFNALWKELIGAVAGGHGNQSQGTSGIGTQASLIRPITIPPEKTIP